MKILLTGATGFIGSRVAAALRRRGHQVVSVNRQPDPTDISQIAGNFARDTDAAVWLPRLVGVDVVVNAVGIIRESGSQSFSALHIQGPRALFDACVQAGVRKVIQISALGADEAATSRYHVSKASADRYLQTLPLEWVVLRPSLVFGLGGASTRLLTAVASLPLVPLIGRGEQCVQPVHVDDLVELCVLSIESSAMDRLTIDVVGLQAYTMKDLLAELRSRLGLAAARFVSVPLGLVRLGAAVCGVTPGSLLDRETLGMLERGNTADAAGFAAALGRPPRAPILFVSEETSEAVLAWARESWTTLLMRWSLAIVWIVTGLLSLGIYPVKASLVLLGHLGLTGTPASVALYGAAGLDLLLGLGVLLFHRRRWLWKIQFGLVVSYSLAIAIALPEYLLHPFGPVLKNVALLAMILVLHETDGRKSR